MIFLKNFSLSSKIMFLFFKKIIFYFIVVFITNHGNFCVMPFFIWIKKEVCHHSIFVTREKTKK